MHFGTALSVLAFQSALRAQALCNKNIQCGSIRRARAV